MKIAFDIDGTVFTQGNPEKDYRDAEVLTEMVEVVNELYWAGHEIYFYTARHFKHFIFTDQALKKAGFKYHGLVMNKISCDLYVDDKGFRMNNNIGELKELIKDLKSNVKN